MNRLATETSPYLRQHAENPVPWYPWGPEALERARAEDKPLFVSIGYASCHWCHVMAHESFEDPATAADLARSFVPVKVDREERPDVDAVYMGAVQALTGSGGWPLSVFCTPDGRPFFGGTYFPPSDRHGLPAFRRVVGAMAEAWASRRDEVEQQADAVTEAVAREARMLDQADRRPLGPAPAGPTFSEVLERLVAYLGQRFDERWGGFGAAPKFPRPTLVELCLTHHLRTGDPRSRTMALTTLAAMAAGGIHDHVAGGFCRYSTDDRWLVPHFEKMLTDQALLARAYLHAWQATGDPTWRQVMAETLDYVLADLAAPGGACFSSLDADAGGVEGGHATFTPAQVRSALDAAGRPELAGPALEWYGISPEGNWEGATIPFRPVGAPLERPPEVEAARRILADARRRRPQPALDDKVLTEWNAMFASTLAQAAAATGTERWAERSEAIMEFLFAHLRRAGDGRWLRSWQAGTARHLAYAGDLAWVVDACVRLCELTGRARWAERAVETADALLTDYWDGVPPGPGPGAATGTGSGPAGPGGLFVTGHDAEALVVRPKELTDGAVPSSNAAGATALLRLGALTGDDRYREAGELIVELAAPLLAEHPAACADVVTALGLADEGVELLVAGDRPDLLAPARSRWLPTLTVAWGEPTSGPLWEGRRDGLAYLCRHRSCQAPAGDPETLAGQLDELVLGSAGRPSGPPAAG